MIYTGIDRVELAESEQSDAILFQFLFTPQRAFQRTLHNIFIINLKY